MSKETRSFAIALTIWLLLIPVMPGHYWTEWPTAVETADGSGGDTGPPQQFTVTPHDIRIREFFRYLDEVVAVWDSVLPYELSEHLLVRANPWIIDSLEHTDYYRRKQQGDTVLDQPNRVVLHRGDTLYFPDSLTARALQERMAHTQIDVNVPEYRLRIIENGAVLYSFPVRVGKNTSRYLATAGHNVDLRTRSGRGQVIRHDRNPLFINPVDGKRFVNTHRDDRVLTRMPIVPWVEIELDGQRYGQLIHPTTNPETLGRAYSNGCIGLGEAEAWRFYYYAPLGTPVTVRYDLLAPGPAGDTVRLEDIYRRKGRAVALGRK